MGRNLFRRYILIGLLFSTNLFAQKLEIRQNVVIGLKPVVKHFPSQKGLRSETIYSFPFEMNEQIEKSIDFYSKPDKIAYLNRAMNRSLPFQNHIRSLIKKYDLPRELYYLPIVESAYRIDATSRSGAAGMWQFMLNSIGPYDMRVNEWLDERRDFWKSSEGALKKLLYNYEKTGDWHLALAAYNCGLNGMRRIIKSSDVHDYWELSRLGLLPGETSKYLAKFLAISIICSYGGRYGLKVNWEPTLEWERIPLPHAVDLRLISKETRIDYELLTLGNGELFYPVTPPTSDAYKLKIPTIFADSLKKMLVESENQFISFYRYSIKTGDTLSDLSQHYKVPLEMIYTYNENVSPQYLRAGQIIIIPALFETKAYRSDEEELIEFSDSYIVQKGDSLWSISGRFSITPELLALRNKLPVNGTLNIGMKLSVP